MARKWTGDTETGEPVTQKKWGHPEPETAGTDETSNINKTMKNMAKTSLRLDIFYFSSLFFHPQRFIMSVASIGSLSPAVKARDDDKKVSTAETDKNDAGCRAEGSF